MGGGCKKCLFFQISLFYFFEKSFVLLSKQSFVFFGPKMAVSWRLLVFQKLVCWYFCSVFLGARFLGQVVKKGNFWTPPPLKTRKMWLIIEKLNFEDFLCFIVFFVWVLFALEGLRVRWGGPSGPPHLALYPPYFVLVWFVLFCFCVFFLFFLFFGGFKGQVRWPKGPPCGPNPPYVLGGCFVFFCFCCCFFFVFEEKPSFFFPTSCFGVSVV